MKNVFFEVYLSCVFAFVFACFFWGGGVLVRSKIYLFCFILPKLKIPITSKVLILQHFVVQKELNDCLLLVLILFNTIIFAGLSEITSIPTTSRYIHQRSTPTE